MIKHRYGYDSAFHSVTIALLNTTQYDPRVGPIVPVPRSFAAIGSAIISWSINRVLGHEALSKIALFNIHLQIVVCPQDKAKRSES